MGISLSGVEWDKGNRTKCQKHGVSVEDIEYILLRSAKLILPDIAHSTNETRYIAFGDTKTDRSILIIFTLRITSEGRIGIRPFSARFMHQKEIDHYEKKAAQQRKEISPF